MQQHFVGVLILLILIMLLNLESGLGRILYLGVIVLCLGVLGLVFGTILLMIITFAFIRSLAKVNSRASNSPFQQLNSFLDQIVSVYFYSVLSISENV